MGRETQPRGIGDGGRRGWNLLQDPFPPRSEIESSKHAGTVTQCHCPESASSRNPGWSDSDSYFRFNALGPILEYQKAKKDSAKNKFLLWPLIDINCKFTALIDYNNTYYGCFPPLIFQHTNHVPWTFYGWNYQNILPKKRLKAIKGVSSSNTALLGLFNTASRETGKILPLESHRDRSEAPRTPKTESSFFALAYYQSHTEYKKWDTDKINPKLAAEICSALRKANSAANMLAAGKRVLKNREDKDVETRKERKRLEEQIKKHEEERNGKQLGKLYLFFIPAWTW